MPKFEEFDDMVPLMKKAYEGTEHAGVEPDIMHLKRQFLYCLSYPNFFIRVAERQGKVVGVLAAVATPNVWGEMAAMPLISYSAYETDKLISEYEKWARDMKCQILTLVTLNERPRYKRIAEHKGLKGCGEIMTKRLT
jgi:hypothetical protein